MPEEIVFEVRDSIAIRAVPIGLDEAGLRERDHLQEWVVSNPEVLGEGILIVATEYGRWVTASGSGSFRPEQRSRPWDGRRRVRTPA